MTKRETEADKIRQEQLEKEAAIENGEDDGTDDLARAAEIADDEEDDGEESDGEEEEDSEVGF